MPRRTPRPSSRPSTPLRPARPTSAGRSRATSLFRSRALGLAAAVACLSAAGTARADYVGDMWNGRSEKFCPLIFGEGCRHTISADLVVAHQPTWSADNGQETYLRAGVELAYGHRITEDVHLGPVIEFGSQDGQFMTGFHIIPKVRTRYWIAGSAVTLDIAAGGAIVRSWLDTGTAPRNRLGFQVDGGIGLLGALHFVGGFTVLGEPTGLFGPQTQAFIGARVSFVTLILAAAVGLKR